MADLTVTTEAITDIAGITATGHGTIIDIGDVGIFDSVSFGDTKFQSENLLRVESVVITNV